ncbi:MAG: low molecular weight phosphatase family protein [Candidatus Aminicenantales bacterium]
MRTPKSAPAIRAPEKRRSKVLFVCYGNICRSPMAAGLARKRFGGRVEAASAGMAAAGGPASDDAVLVMKIVYQTDISDHEARNITDFELGSFDYIIAMDFPVYSRLRDLKAIPEEKLYGWDIEDPLGRGYDAYKETARKIDRRLEQFAAKTGLEP